MTRTRRPLLAVEQLEHRDCPTLVLRLTSGSLFVTGSPSHTGNLTFLQTNPNQWKVTDGTVPLGTYNATNVTLNLTQHQGTPIVFNLNNKTDGGNLQINLGTGDSSGDAATGGVTVLNGTLGGNLTLLNGSGIEDVQLGYSAVTMTAPGLTVGGNVTFDAKENPNLTSGGFPVGNLLDLGVDSTFGPPAITVGGSVTTFGVGGVGIAATTTVGKDLNITTQRDALYDNTNGPVIFGKVGGNVSIRGAASSPLDYVEIGNPTAAKTASIGGNLSISLGTTNFNGGGFMNVGNEVRFFGSPTISGNTSIQEGDGNNFTSLDALFNGDLNLQLGNGNNTDGTGSPDFTGAFFPTTAVVNGNFSLTAGNGNNNLTTAGNPFAGSVAGNTHVALGNGTDSFVVASANLGGPLNWNSGNGNDSLTLAAPAGGSANYNIHAQFGNGDDSLTLGSGVSVSGSADGGGRITGNVFNPMAGSLILQPFTLSNFP